VTPVRVSRLREIALQVSVERAAKAPAFNFDAIAHAGPFTANL
jgi:hypothetical protein